MKYGMLPLPLGLLKLMLKKKKIPYAIDIQGRELYFGDFIRIYSILAGILDTSKLISLKCGMMINTTEI